MSRTDVHRPYEIQLKDPYNRPHLVRYGWGSRDCYLIFQVCGCRMCTQHWERKWARQAERKAWKLARARIMQLVDKSDVDEHVYIQRRERYWYISSLLKNKAGDVPDENC